MKLKRNGRFVGITVLCRHKKTNAVRSAKRRNKKSWNPHHYLVSAARRVFRWSPEKKLVANNCAVGTTRRRCASCAGVYPRKLVHIDHIEPVGLQPRAWDDYPEFYRRLFCDASNLQGLCKECHGKKTQKDIKEMRK